MEDHHTSLVNFPHGFVINQPSGGVQVEFSTGVHLHTSEQNHTTVEL